MLRFDLIQKVHAYATEKAKAAGKSIDWSMTTNGTLVDARRRTNGLRGVVSGIC